MNVDAVRARYVDLIGHVPETLNERIALAEAADRLDAIAAVEACREELLHRNPLQRRVQQLVQLAMLIGAGEAGPALVHARGALKAGASVRDLFGVCEIAAVVGGMPAFTRAVGVVTRALGAPPTERPGA